MGNTITISAGEYKALLEARVRIEVFSDFVKNSKYNTVEKEECARYLGFKNNDKES